MGCETPQHHGAKWPSHAYLFLGLRQIGKSTLARVFAQALLCTGKVCSHAVNVERAGSSPKVAIQIFVGFSRWTRKNGEVDRLDGLLRTEQAAEIIHEVALRPAEGRYKVFIIQDAHNANDTFANKLLKTLEEPPAMPSSV